MAEEEKKAKEENSEEAPSGGSKKLLIIGLLLGLVVGGGGAAGALIMMGGDGEHAEAPVEEEVVEEVVEELPEYLYVKIEKFNVPLVRNNRLLGYMMMDLSLEMEGEDDKLRVSNKLFVIRDAFLKDVTDTPVGKPDNPRMIDYDALKKRLKDAANHVLHKDIVRQVLVVEARKF